MMNIQAALLTPVVGTLKANKVLARHGSNDDRRVEFGVCSAVADILGVETVNLSLAIEDLMAAEANGEEFAEDDADRAAAIVRRLAYWGGVR